MGWAQGRVIGGCYGAVWEGYGVGLLWGRVMGWVWLWGGSVGWERSWDAYGVGMGMGRDMGPPWGWDGVGLGPLYGAGLQMGALTALPPPRRRLKRSGSGSPTSACPQSPPPPHGATPAAMGQRRDTPPIPPHSPHDAAPAAPSIAEVAEELRPLLLWLANGVELLNLAQGRVGELEAELEMDGGRGGR